MTTLAMGALVVASVLISGCAPAREALAYADARYERELSLEAGPGGQPVARYVIRSRPDFRVSNSDVPDFKEVRR